MQNENEIEGSGKWILLNCEVAVKVYFHALLVPLNSLQCLRFSSYQAGAVGQVYFRGYYLNRNCRVRQKQPTVKITMYFVIPFFAGD